ncbi:uncharacterized protein LOC142980575 isoform X2 [Anticarsia gemmatalis]|uniref:uncharacterized protein LOC142980575 isoform X2 n=1 Tax=Anticarsia gemmatalis TaxID=129554 RepID=UPI003F77315F
MFLLLSFICVSFLICIGGIPLKNQIDLERKLSNDWFISREEYNLTPNEPAYFMFNCDHIQKIRCESLLYGYEFCRFDYDDIKKLDLDKVIFDGTNSHCYFELLNVTDSMDDNWMCKIGTYSADDINVRLRVHVDGAKPPQILLVNLVVQKLKKVTSEKFVSTYDYLAGDDIVFTCASTRDECTVHMEYENFDLFYDFLKPYDNITNHHHVGFHKRLQPSDNNTRAVCKSICGKEPNVTVALTFMLKNKLDDILTVQINGLTVRGERQILSSDNIPTVIYKCGTGALQKISITCFTDNHELVVSPKHDRTYREKRKSTHITTELMPEYESVVMYEVKDNDPSGVPRTKEIVRITFAQFIPNSYQKFSVNLPEKNVVIKMFEYTSVGSMYLYYIYEYYEGDLLTLNCTNSMHLVPPPYHYIDFNGTVHNKTTTSVSKLINLTSALNNTNFKCLDAKNYYDSYNTKINVLFLMKLPNEIVSVNKTEIHRAKNHTPIIAVAVAVVSIVLACILAIVVYKNMTKKQEPRGKTAAAEAFLK